MYNIEKTKKEKNKIFLLSERVQKTTQICLALCVAKLVTISELAL